MLIVSCERKRESHVLRRGRLVTRTEGIVSARTVKNLLRFISTRRRKDRTLVHKHMTIPNLYQTGVVLSTTPNQELRHFTSPPRVTSSNQRPRSREYLTNYDRPHLNKDSLTQYSVPTERTNQKKCLWKKEDGRWYSTSSCPGSGLTDGLEPEGSDVLVLFI